MSDQFGDKNTGKIQKPADGGKVINGTPPTSGGNPPPAPSGTHCNGQNGYGK